MRTSIKAILLSSALLIRPAMSLAGGERVGASDADREINNRLDKMQTIVQPGNMNLVRWKISSYLDRDPRSTEIMLGRMAQYFPLIEQQLRAAEMPEDLKYLPIIESSLRPNAVSHMGAVGMWQFMYYTGRENGLRIDRVVDERRDPLEATEAAIKYLSSLHERFGDWTLAIAAYNSGPGRVERAIRYSNSRNFWELMRFLPRETREYIPKYIAAAYLCKHYQEHGLEPQWPSLDMQLTGDITVHKTLSLYKVSEWTDLPYSDIRGLNPGFQKGYIPASKSGYRLTLPRRYLPIVEARLKGMQDVQKETSSPYIEAVYHVRSGESLETIARIFEVHATQLKYWNGLSGKEELCAGRELTIYLERTKRNEWLVEDRARIEMDPLESRPLMTVNRDPILPDYPEEYSSTAYADGILSRHSMTIRRGEGLRETAIEMGARKNPVWEEWIRRFNEDSAPPGTSVIQLE